GEELYAQVEELRQGTIRRREADDRGAEEDAGEHAARAMALVHGLPVDRALLLTRAFGFYFELINLAETNHRKRRRLAHQLRESAFSSSLVQRGDLRGTLRRMREAGITAD